MRLRWYINLFADGDDREGDWNTKEHYLRDLEGNWKFVGGPDPDDGQLEFREHYSVEAAAPLYMVLNGWTYWLGDPWAGPYSTLGGWKDHTQRGGARLAGPHQMENRVVQEEVIGARRVALVAAAEHWRTSRQ